MSPTGSPPTEAAPAPSVPAVGGAGAHVRVAGAARSGGPGRRYTFAVRPASRPADPGWTAWHIPTLGLDFQVPALVTRLDPRGEDPEQQCGNAPIMVMAGSLPEHLEGLDEAGNSVSVRALAGLRTAAAHACLGHQACRALPDRPEVEEASDHGPHGLAGAIPGLSPVAPAAAQSSGLSREELSEIVDEQSIARLPSDKTVLLKQYFAERRQHDPDKAVEELAFKWGLDTLGATRRQVVGALGAELDSGGWTGSNAKKLLLEKDKLEQLTFEPASRPGASREELARDLDLLKGPAERTEQELPQMPPAGARNAAAAPCAAARGAAAAAGATGPPEFPSLRTPGVRTDAPHLTSGAVLGGLPTHMRQPQPQLSGAAPSLDAFVQGLPRDQLFAGVPSSTGRVGAPEDSASTTFLGDIAQIMGAQFKHTEESSSAARGQPTSITRSDELSVLAIRGLDRFTVKLCSGEWGKPLYKAIKRTAETSTGLIKHIGWPTPISNRQAFGIASLSRGGKCGERTSVCPVG